MLEKSMIKKQSIRLIEGLLNRGISSKDATSLFAKMSHEDLVCRFTDYLNKHRHFLGYCHIETSHALNDKGVDVLLLSGGCKVGFQLKSHYDVTEEEFAANVKRQLAESFCHDLDQYYPKLAGVPLNLSSLGEVSITQPVEKKDSFVEQPIIPGMGHLLKTQGGPLAFLAEIGSALLKNGVHTITDQTGGVGDGKVVYQEGGGHGLPMNVDDTARGR